MKKRITRFMSFLLCILLLLSSSVYAGEKEQTSDVFYEVAASYAESVAGKHIETLLGTKPFNPNNLNEMEPFYIGKGIKTYCLKNGNTVQNSTYEFPIFQNDKVVMTVYVDYVDGQWTSGASFELNELLNSVNIYQGKVVYDEAGNCYFDKELSTLSEKEGEEITYLGYFKSPIDENSIITYANGFHVNDPTYKLLNTDYCLVLQRDPSGRERGLCWAATAATMIRYLMGDRTLESFQLADEMGIGYDQGGTIADIRRALVRHKVTTQYKALNRPASSITEVYHNINNQFPIAMGSTGKLIIFPTSGHAVTIVGYNVNNLIFWNSATHAFGTAEYKGASTSFRQSGVTYKWKASVLIPLN